MDWDKYAQRKDQRGKRPSATGIHFLSNVPEVENDIEYRLSVLLVGRDANLLAKLACEKNGGPSVKESNRRASKEGMNFSPPIKEEHATPIICPPTPPEGTLPNMIGEKPMRPSVEPPPGHLTVSRSLASDPAMSLSVMADAPARSVSGDLLGNRGFQKESSVQSLGFSPSSSVSSTNSGFKFTPAGSVSSMGSSPSHSDDRCSETLHVTIHGQKKFVKLELKSISNFLDSVPVPHSKMEAENTAFVFVVREGDAADQAAQLKHLRRAGVEFNFRLPRDCKPLRTCIQCVSSGGSERSPSLLSFLNDFSIEESLVQEVHDKMDQKDLLDVLREIARFTLEAQIDDTEGEPSTAPKPKESKWLMGLLGGVFSPEDTDPERSSCKRGGSLRSLAPAFSAIKKKISLGSTSKPSFVLSWPKLPPKFTGVIGSSGEQASARKAQEPVQKQ